MVTSRNACYITRLRRPADRSVEVTSTSAPGQSAVGAPPTARGERDRGRRLVPVSDHSIPAAEHALCRSATQSVLADTAPSLTTVAAMFCGVTHVGVRYTDWTCALACVSCVVAFIRPDGGVWPARRYSASAAAACASR